MLKVHGILPITFLKMIMTDNIYQNIKMKRINPRKISLKFIMLSIPKRPPSFILTEKWLTMRRVVFRLRMCGKEQGFYLQTIVSLTSRDLQQKRERTEETELTFLYLINMHQMLIVHQPLHKALGVE